MPFGKAIPAATIVLVRDRDDRIEIFMQKRNSRTSFGGLYVFPGGKVSEDDSRLKKDGLMEGLTPEEADNKLKVKSDGIEYWIAAVRECFEESGFLLAYNGHNELVDFIDEDIKSRFQEYRRKINAKELSFSKMCRKERLTLALDRIYPCAHWITPPGSFKRYDTRFFIARAPEKQEGDHDNHEAVDSLWITPQGAIDRYYQRIFPLISPTYHTIETLMPFTTVDGVLSYMSEYVPGRPRSF